MKNIEVNLTPPLNCVINQEDKSVSFSEYGEHILTITIDELLDIQTAYITGQST